MTRLLHHKMAQKSHSITEKAFRLFLCLCGILWFCGVGFAEEAEHAPRHGGQFGDADDLYHYEVLLEAPSRLVLYVNDEHNQPLDVRPLAGRWTLDPDGPSPATGTFQPEDSGRYFFASLPLAAGDAEVHVKVEVLKGNTWASMEFFLPAP